MSSKNTFFMVEILNIIEEIGNSNPNPCILIGINFNFGPNLFEFEIKRIFFLMKNSTLKNMKCNKEFIRFKSLRIKCFGHFALTKHSFPSKNIC